MDKIINYLPTPYKKDSWIQAIMQAAQVELDKLEIDAIQLGNELLLNLTSEKQLTVEEILCGLIPTLSQNIGDRKAVVSAKWKVKNIITLDTLQAIADSWEDGKVICSYPDADYLRLDFESNVKDYNSMLKAIRNTMPAHIPLFASVLYDFPDNTLYFGSVVQVAENINVFSNSNVDFNSINFAFVTQIADTVNVFTPASIKDKLLFITTTVQIADFIFIK